MNIQILTEKTNYWHQEYNHELVNRMEKLGHHVEVIHSKNALAQGDIAFFLGCFELVDVESLKLHDNNIVVHSSDLPQGKGWSPLTWQILEGKNTIPMTLFEADESCDGGLVYIKDEIKLNGTELIDEIRHFDAQKCIEMCVRFVKNRDALVGKKQSGAESYYSRRYPQDSELDIHKSIDEQFNLLRVVDNERYPAFFIKNGVKYILKIEKYK